MSVAPSGGQASRNFARPWPAPLEGIVRFVPAKLLILGIDAASPDLLRRWAGEGKLPAIRSLLDRGTSGAIRGVEGFFVGSTWPSLYTGLNPAGHGFYRIDQLK